MVVWEKIYTIIILVFIIIILGGYLGYDKCRRNYDKGYQQGVKDGVDATIVQVAAQSSNCQIMTLSMGNESIRLVDVSCIQQV